MGRLLDRRDPLRLARDHVLKEIADLAGIRKILRRAHFPENDLLPHMLLRVIIQRVLVFFAVHEENVHQLINRVVREFNVLIEARAKPRVAVDKILHEVRVARDDHDKIVPMVLHRLEDRVDRLLPERVVLRGQGVGLVDKEHAAERLLDLLRRLDRRLADVARHESRPVRLDKLPLREHADLLVNPCENARDRRLACARISRKHEVERDRDRLQPLVLPHFLDPDK